MLPDNDMNSYSIRFEFLSTSLQPPTNVHRRMFCLFGCLHTVAFDPTSPRRKHILWILQYVFEFSLTSAWLIANVHSSALWCPFFLYTQNSSDRICLEVPTTFAWPQVDIYTSTRPNFILPMSVQYPTHAVVDTRCYGVCINLLYWKCWLVLVRRVPSVFSEWESLVFVLFVCFGGRRSCLLRIRPRTLFSLDTYSRLNRKLGVKTIVG